jgi:hypothetical protein
VSAAGPDPVLRLLELTEAEHRLAADRDTDGLAAVQDERFAALGMLPTSLDPTQREMLARAFALGEQTTELLRAARDEVAAELAKLGTGRAAMRGYTPAGSAPGPSFDASA